jgi:hypothetical protein
LRALITRVSDLPTFAGYLPAVGMVGFEDVLAIASGTATRDVKCKNEMGVEEQDRRRCKVCGLSEMVTPRRPYHNAETNHGAYFNIGD